MPTVASAAALTSIAVLSCTAAEPDSSGRLPPPEPDSTAIICHANEPGPRLLVSGRVLDAAGAPIPGASVTAWNTDANGLYNPRNSPTREPRIKGTVTTDAEGRFQILTTRPGAYPDGTDPRHIHFKATKPGYQLRYSDIWFEGDPLITPARLAQMRQRTAEHTNEVTAIEPTRQLEGGLEVVEHTVRLRTN
jgi:protocatechuate 3,4-dioxygenase beta subunit